MTDSKFKVIAEQGDIHVDYVDVLYSSDFCYVLEIGTEQKYPGTGGYCSGEYQTLMSSEDKDQAPDEKITKIEFFYDKKHRNWFHISEPDRYHVNVVLWADTGYRERIWRES